MGNGGELYFYDALAPIVAAESLDHEVIFAQSRYDKGDGADYLNIPLSQDDYEAFVDAILSAESMPLHAFEEPRYFQGCMPIEVLAASGRETLRFGCMKPVGLTDPRTDQSPYAVVQLRKEDRAGQSYNLVGFQTKLKWPEQKRIFAALPGMAKAQFLRLGQIHRNTYVDAPAMLTAGMALKTAPHCRLAGQLTGVEGYVESAAHGLLVAALLASDLREIDLPSPPQDTALGALLGHVRGSQKAPGTRHEPQNVHWAMFPPVAQKMRKRAKKEHRLARARTSFAEWAPKFAALEASHGQGSRSAIEGKRSA